MRFPSRSSRDDFIKFLFDESHSVIYLQFCYEIKLASYLLSIFYLISSYCFRLTRILIYLHLLKNERKSTTHPNSNLKRNPGEKQAHKPECPIHGDGIYSWYFWFYQCYYFRAWCHAVGNRIDNFPGSFPLYPTMESENGGLRTKMDFCR